jgi:hypothetical protein
METYEYYNMTNNDSQTWSSLASVPEPHASWFAEAHDDPDGFVKVGDEFYSIVYN